MERERDDDAKTGGCCAGAPGRDGAQTEPSASCDCCGSGARRPWFRTAIAVVVILAAVAVGAYSLAKKPAAAPGSQTTPCSATGSSAGATCQPGDAAQQAGTPACCAGASGGCAQALPQCAGTAADSGASTATPAATTDSSVPPSDGSR